MSDMRRQSGYAMVTVMLLMALLMTFLLGYFTLTMIELSTTRSTQNSFVGFYAAEAGLNVRADIVAQLFTGYARPAGVAPDASEGYTPCTDGNMGSGDFVCVDYSFQNRTVTTYLEESEGSTLPIVVPRGEPLQNVVDKRRGY